MLLFVMFPQFTLQEPKDCVFIRSMMRFFDVSFRRGCGSAVIQGVLTGFLGPGKGGRGLACVFGGAVVSFLCEGKPERKKDARG